MARACALCRSKDSELAAERAKSAELLLALQEVDKLCTLLKADIARVRGEREKLEPNRSERLSGDELQLVFEGIVTALGSAANDGTTTSGGDGGTSAASNTDAATTPSAEAEGASPSSPNTGIDAAVAQVEGATPSSPNTGSGAANPGAPNSGAETNKKKGHGRRPMDLSKLPVQDVVVEPAEVAANPERYCFIGNECSERLAHREASYIRIRLIRPKYKLIEEQEPETPRADPSTKSLEQIEMERTPPTVVCASIPSYLWPRTMADVSAITHVILSKYDMCLPLNRQERASSRCGIHLSRSTQCDWLSAAHDQVYRIVDAMMAEACRTAFCIATDATGAPVRMPRVCANWHLFVFIADADHVIFRPTREHSSAAIAGLLDGFQGHLLSDASLIYDALHRDGITEVCCWFHLRRYFWKARATEPRRALEVLAIIAKLFEVGRETNLISMPDRTEERARRARPILELLDRWIAHERGSVDERSPLAAAITYYDNQRNGLRAFLTDGRLRLDNNISEGQLRHLVVGRHNWNFFENESGLRWYAVFRSLIASCTLHGLEAKTYLDEVLRLAPHWPTTRMLELSPKYWAATRAALSPEQRDTIVPPWMRADEAASPTSGTVAA